MVNAPESQHHVVQHFSTGRGGAANIKKVTASAPQPVVVHSESTALTRGISKASLGARFATGRGGAGNMLPSGQAPLPPTTEALKTSSQRTIVSTGRGGAGNYKDATSGRSVSASSIARPKFLVRSTSERAEGGASQTDRPTWAIEVPRIEAELHESAVDDEEEEGSHSFFGKMRRRLSSFGSARG